MTDKPNYDEDSRYHTDNVTWEGRVEQTFGSELIKELKAEIPRGIILEVGASIGETTKDLSSIFGENVQVVGIEVDRSMFVDSEFRRRTEQLAKTMGIITKGNEKEYKSSGRKPIIFAADGYNPPFAENSFEAVFIMNNLFQSVQQGGIQGESLKSVMKNISEIVKPRGFLCISGRDHYVIYRFDEDKQPKIWKIIETEADKNVFSAISEALEI